MMRPFDRGMAFRALALTGANHLAFRMTRGSLRILCYHGAWTSRHPHFGNKIFIGRNTFRQRLETLARLRCNVLPLLEALEGLKDGTLPPRAAAITIDDGWASTFDFMLPELRKFRLPATIYVQTQKLVSGAPVHDVAISFALSATPLEAVELPPDLARQGRASPEGPHRFDLKQPGERARLSTTLNDLFDSQPEAQRWDTLLHLLAVMKVATHDLVQARVFRLGTEADVRHAAAGGFEIALHTHTHTLGDFSPDVISDEIHRNRQVLGRILDRPVEHFRHFCWPSGSYTRQAALDLRANGIDVATTCDAGLATRSSHPLLLPRMLDGELTTTAEFVAQMSGAKSLPRMFAPAEA